MDARSAWALARTADHPEEVPFAMEYLRDNEEGES